MSDVTAVICYLPGTKDMLDACLSSIARHTERHLSTVLVLWSMGRPFDAYDVVERSSLPHVGVIPVNCMLVKSAWLHAYMLDTSIWSFVQTDLILTLDSDCLPVADGWLDFMVDAVKDGSWSSGISFPLSPASHSCGNAVADRYRMARHWDRGHVACQLYSKRNLVSLGVHFCQGLDAGLGISDELERRSWQNELKLLRPTRCPLAEREGDDPELNRLDCVVFGDMVYHHGAYSCDQGVKKQRYSMAKARVLEHRGAEFLLDDTNSHCYAFDREDEAALRYYMTIVTKGL